MVDRGVEVGAARRQGGVRQAEEVEVALRVEAEFGYGGARLFLAQGG